MRALTVTENSGPEALTLTDVDTPEPGEGEVCIDVEAAGLNFADIEKCRGVYPETQDPPFTAGLEAAGRITDVGPNVDWVVGERVACIGRGAFAERMLVDNHRVFNVPDSLDPEKAAAIPIQWLTAHNCLFEWGSLEPDETVLIHAAAGGVGTAAVQLATEAGATVIGTASTEAKLRFAADHGMDHGVNYEQEDIVDRIECLTGGSGPDLVLDGVGGRAFKSSMEVLAESGRLVTYGMASGRPGSVVTPNLFFSNQAVIGYHLEHALEHERERVLQAAGPVYRGLANGTLEPVVDDTYPLEEAPRAYRALNNRDTRGKVVLTP